MLRSLGKGSGALHAVRSQLDTAIQIYARPAVDGSHTLTDTTAFLKVLKNAERMSDDAALELSNAWLSAKMLATPEFKNIATAGGQIQTSLYPLTQVEQPLANAAREAASIGAIIRSRRAGIEETGYVDVAGLTALARSITDGIDQAKAAQELLAPMRDAIRRMDAETVPDLILPG
jgi:hypothetical protein